MFEELEGINTRPEPFQFYTASDLWTDEHTSKQMLAFHLNADIDVASRNADSLAAFRQREEAATYEANLLNGFWSPDSYYGFLNTFKYEEEKVVLDKYTLIEASRTRTVYNWLQYFNPEALEREFVECGFTVDRLHSDVAGSHLSTRTLQRSPLSPRRHRDSERRTRPCTLTGIPLRSVPAGDGNRWSLV